MDCFPVNEEDCAHERVGRVRRGGILRPREALYDWTGQCAECGGTVHGSGDAQGRDIEWA